ncbi:MAG TPA: 2-amino-4-hydroxy-6-hydroxymethyldihydropteridine diphosphokinase [Dehalococcoidia bacterium]|nr:2-amino-4-hydroxy-6-hydroxymethyldihydropteridine diphosphokinase [Dehalococcoidia bacterium]
MSERVFLGLGSNIGDRRANMRAALRWLAPECDVVAVSSLYRSEAVVLEGQLPGPEYLNAACEVRTALSPDELLDHVKRIEHDIGRRPGERWAPRPIDIDVLLYGSRAIGTERLTIPHPLLGERAFVLAPLAEIARDVVHPAARRTIEEMARAAGHAGVERVAGPDWASGLG